MYGNVKDGFQTEEKFIFAMIADIILERKKIGFLDRFHFECRSHKSCPDKEQNTKNP